MSGAIEASSRSEEEEGDLPEIFRTPDAKVSGSQSIRSTPGLHVA